MTTKCIGDNGFGFDEIFMLPNNLTLAQISTEEKYKISPRTKALDMIKEIINNI
jgi:inosine/xanthosine triphosphate pyrophosphatase family protein